MKVLIHDLTNEEYKTIFPQSRNDLHVISDKGKIKRCIGCFGCWVKTPGKCVLKDGYENMGSLLAEAEEVILISRCFYGSYSPFVKTVMERWLSYLLPFFTLVNHDTHHKLRYSNRFRFTVYFYGNQLTDREKSAAEALVKANSVNFQAEEYTVHFADSPLALEGVGLR